MEFFQIRNFEKYQHYKDRRPPWVKLYRDLWQDPNFFGTKSVQKLYIIGFFTLASETENRIPADTQWIQSRLGILEPPDFKALIKSGFIKGCSQRASKMLAKCSTDNEEHSIVYKEETETYKEETERDKAQPKIIPSDPCSEIFKIWQNYKPLLQHKKLSPEDRRHISSALELFQPGELITAIDRYAQILSDATGRYWLDNRWTIGEFVSRKGHKWITVFNSDNWQEQLLTNERRKKLAKEKQESAFWENLEASNG